MHQALLDLAELVELGPLGADPGVVGVEDGGDAALFGEGGEGKPARLDIILVDADLGNRALGTPHEMPT